MQYPRILVLLLMASSVIGITACGSDSTKDAASPLFYDDITTRSDTAAGSIGSPQVGPAWNLTGAGAATARILNGEMVSPNGVIYAWVRLPSDVSHFGGRWRYNKVSSNVMVMAMFGNVTLTAIPDLLMLHPLFGPTGARAQIWTTGTFFAPASLKAQFATGITAVPTNGDVIQADIWVDRASKSFHCELRNVTQANALLVTLDGSDPILDATYLGRSLFWEPGPDTNLLAAWAYGPQQP